MSKFYTYDAWVDTFKPIKNTVTKYPDTVHFETYGEEVEFVAKQDYKHVWTEVDGEEGCYIIAGFHYVNRIQYYVTENPWEDENTEVPTWAYKGCECVENGDGDPDPVCKECLGEGVIDVDCDTVEALRVIYGEGANIVG